MKLLQGDCLELMKDIPDKSVDMILCDLPYGTTRNKWDIRIPFQPLWEQYTRVCKKNAAIVLFSQMPFSAELVCSNIKDFRYEWIWRKYKGTGFLNANRMPLKAHENILVFYKALPVYNPQKKSGKPYKGSRSNGHSICYNHFREIGAKSYDGSRHPTTVIDFAACNDSAEYKTVHPTQKPVPLLEYLIETYTNEGETVLDNCMGSGSTGVACVNTGRVFIGMELDEGYFEIAKQRIEEAQKNNER